MKAYVYKQQLTCSILKANIYDMALLLGFGFCFALGFRVGLTSGRIDPW